MQLDSKTLRGGRNQRPKAFRKFTRPPICWMSDLANNSNSHITEQAFGFAADGDELRIGERFDQQTHCRRALHKF